MVRGKVQMRKIENPVYRRVTFCKRRAGLLKKAKELSVLCDVDVGLIIFSSRGKLYELSTKGTIQELVERYLNPSVTESDDSINVNNQAKSQKAEVEISVLKQEIEMLHKGMRNMFGEGKEKMTYEQLNVLEKQLEVWIYDIRSAKVKNMIQEIESLKNKEMILKAANEILLQEKSAERSIVRIVEEQSGLLNVSQMM